MKTRLTLRPGQNGTKKLVAKYGGRLVAVRYRYDEERRLRFKTIELVVEQIPWIPRVQADRSPNERVLVRINYDEADLRVAAKNAGARWNQERKLWELPLGTVYAMGLDRRIVS
ncbi:MAG: hypothetical protein ACT4PK_08755 [Gammaproteobacteria bacterium]